MDSLTIKGRIWIETDSGLKIGMGRALLLEQIDITGSITEAAKVLNIPYRRAWGIIKEINNNASEEIVVKEAGGASGGKSSLTAKGKKIVATFKEADEKFKKFSKDESGRFSGWKKL